MYYIQCVACTCRSTVHAKDGASKVPPVLQHMRDLYKRGFLMTTTIVDLIQYYYLFYHCFICCLSLYCIVLFMLQSSNLSGKKKRKERHRSLFPLLLDKTKLLGGLGIRSVILKMFLFANISRRSDRVSYNSLQMI